MEYDYKNTIKAYSLVDPMVCKINSLVLVFTVYSVNTLKSVFTFICKSFLFVFFILHFLCNSVYVILF